MADTQSTYYLPSTNVRVFPLSNSRSTHPNDSLLNEHNLTSLINLFSDKESFVISYNETDKVIKFVIKGYYFECTLGDSLPFSGVTYAGIQIDQEQLSGSDVVNGTNDAKFQGITFSDDQLDDSYITLQLFENETVVNTLKYDAHKIYNLNDILKDYLKILDANNTYALQTTVTSLQTTVDELVDYVDTLKPQEDYTYTKKS